MTNKKLIILSAVAVIMIILTVVQSYLSHRPVQSRTMDSPLIQGLDTAAIDKISLGSPESTRAVCRCVGEWSASWSTSHPTTVR